MILIQWFLLWGVLNHIDSVKYGKDRFTPGPNACLALAFVLIVAFVRSI